MTPKCYLCQSLVTIAQDETKTTYDRVVEIDTSNTIMCGMAEDIKAIVAQALNPLDIPTGLYSRTISEITYAQFEELYEQCPNNT